MRLIILGKSKDDKGTQLEELTSAVLAEAGYAFVCRNYIGSGGNEIDVKAKKVNNLLGKQVELPVVCECKAHGTPVTTTDWLKFVGKVHIERMSNAQTEGVLIALSGANGNVIGSYESLPDKSYLHLLAHENLVNIVCQHFSLKSHNEVKSFIEHKTVRVVDTIDLIYYDKQVFWLTGFTNGDFFVMTNNLIPVEDKLIDGFLTLLEQQTTFEKSKYVDILKESIALYRREVIMKSVVYILMDKETSVELNEMLVFLKHLCHQQDIDIQEVIEAAQGCPIVQFENNIITIKNDGEIDFPAFYRWYTNGQIIVDSIVKSFYSSHINEQLLDAIVLIQQDLNIPTERRSDILEMLRISPSALAYALHPDPMIVVSRKNGAGAIPEMNKHHIDWFVNNLTDFLISDLQNGNYSPFYYTEFGLRNYSIETLLSLKFEDGEKDKKIEDKKYFGIVKTGENITTISLLEDVGRSIMTSLNNSIND